MIPLSYSRSFCCELNVRYITSSLNFTLLGHLNRSSFSKDCELLGLYALHPFALSTLPIRLLFWTVIPVTENSPNLTILAGKRRREKKDQKLQSRTKLLRNLMETFIPWGIRSAFRRGGSPRITELTVTSGLYREISILSPQRHLWLLVVWCSILPYKRMQIILTIGQIFCIYLMCLQMYSFSPLVQKYMKRYVGINVTHKLRNIAFLFLYLGGDNSRLCVFTSILWWSVDVLFIWISVYRAPWTGKYLRWRSTRYSTIFCAGSTRVRKLQHFHLAGWTEQTT